MLKPEALGTTCEPLQGDWDGGSSFRARDLQYQTGIQFCICSHDWKTEGLKRSLLILSSDNFPNSFELMNWWNSLLQGNKQFYMGRGIKLGSDVGFAIQIKKVDDPVQCGASWLQLSDMVIETETQEMAGKADGVCCSMEMKILTMLLVGPGSRLDVSIRTLMSFKVYESVFVWDGDMLQWISSKFL